MPDLSSNRNDPRFVQYYQDMADIIRIFWELHKVRLARHELPYACIELQRNNKGDILDFMPFRPQIVVELVRGKSQTRKVDIIAEYSMCMENTLHTSWRQFLRTPQVKLDPQYDVIAQDPYLLHLLDRAATLGENVSTVDRDKGNKFTVEEIGERGMLTGIDVANQLAGLFGEAFTPITALVLSKVKLQNNRTVIEGIGLPLRHGDPSTHKLIDTDSRTLVAMAELRKLGFGNTLGCPASMRPSAECIAFLKKTLPALGVKNPQIEGTMLDEFAAITAALFQRDIKDWYDQLSDEQRREWLEPYTRARLEGEVYRSLREGGPEAPRCPWHKR